MLKLLAMVVIIGVVLGALLGRFAKAAGGGIILLGVVAFAFSFIYETSIKTTGDTSNVGMLCTLLLITCVPLGIVVAITGSFRSD